MAEGPTEMQSGIVKRPTRLRRAGEVIVMSNRGPLRLQSGKWQRSSGGLVTALDPVLRERGGAWVSADEVPDPAPDLGYALRAARMPRSVQRDFYDGFANAVLWPLLHGFSPTMPLAEAPFEAYVTANLAFAEAAIECAAEEDVFWVQDYHLMLAPRMLRERRPDARIGWFCHIPWPAAEHFAILPWRRLLIEGLLQADVLGFHTARYAENFMTSAERLVGAEVDWERGIVRTAHGATRVLVAPIGVPTQHIRALLGSREVHGTREALMGDVGWRQVILGVDRLDYTKGIPERLRGFEQLLERRPELVERAVLVQLVVPSRERVRAYRDLRDEIEGLVGRINGRFGRPGCMPVHYLYRSLPPERLYGYYRAADVALVTPLRDGMNLVAQEYVAAHDEDDGALVLSEFAGAARYLDGAYKVNPYDVHDVAERLDEALSAKPQETARRMRSLRSKVEELDVHRWADRFLAAIRDVGHDASRPATLQRLASNP